MAVQRVDIERALNELVLQEEGMRFQSLAVVLGRLRWPELIAHERHKDFGLDAYAGLGLTLAWIAARKNILEYIAGMPAFQAQGITAANLASIQTSESFLFLLNGWNEVAETNSTQASDVLRDLERTFRRRGSSSRRARIT